MISFSVSETWESMRLMIAAGQSMSMSGQGWWTLDIGGFKTNGQPNSGNVSNPEYQELYVRWLQWLVFFFPSTS
jgi:alpha-D-xyloside xylohydrolase